MTLVVNEILLRDGGKESWLVAAADRRMWSLTESRPTKPVRKLLEVPYLHGAISYYGVGEVVERGRSRPLVDWLADFIQREYQCIGLEQFVNHLRLELGRCIPQSWLEKMPSGIHFCGHDKDRNPEFWHFCNHSLAPDFQYQDCRSRFYDATNWQANNAQTLIPGPYGVVFWARNGQYLSHAAAWNPLDVVINQLAKFPDFQRPDLDAETYGRYIKFKFEVISHIYKYWAHAPTVGTPIDVLVFRKTKDKIETFDSSNERS